MFCAGADLVDGYRGGVLTLAIHGCRKPTIAAIQGPAVGVSPHFPNDLTETEDKDRDHHDLTHDDPPRLVRREGRVVFSQRGVVMEAASSFFLPRLIGHSKAL